ncbi:MAG: hypothetical protein ACK4MF_02280 [Hyphomicrobiaceae bacterium]
MRVTSSKLAACALTIASATGLLAVSSHEAAAQAMTPMRGEVKSFADRFAIRVFPQNPYKHRIKVEVRVYDETFAPIPTAAVAPAEMMLAPEDNRGVMVVVPFDGLRERRVRVCTESVPFANTLSSRVRTQVCGRFIAFRLS